MSTTKVETSRAHYERSGWYNAHGATYEASETLTYGLTDNWSVYGFIANVFQHDTGLNNEHNFGYTLGTAYNWTADKWLVQLHGEYNTYDPRSWYGKRNTDWTTGNNRWQKFFNAGIKLGYEAGCGFTPYTTFDVDGNFDDADRWLEYSWFVGAHKQVDKWAVDAGVRYDFDSDDNEAWYAQAEANYFVKDNITVGVFGDYYLGGSPQLGGAVTRKDVDYNYDLGLNVKVAF